MNLDKAEKHAEFVLTSGAAAVISILLIIAGVAAATGIVLGGYLMWPMFAIALWSGYAGVSKVKQTIDLYQLEIVAGMWDNAYTSERHALVTTSLNILVNNLNQRLANGDADAHRIGTAAGLVWNNDKGKFTAPEFKSVAEYMKEQIQAK